MNIHAKVSPVLSVKVETSAWELLTLAKHAEGWASDPDADGHVTLTLVGPGGSVVAFPSAMVPTDAVGRSDTMKRPRLPLDLPKADDARGWQDEARDSWERVQGLRKLLGAEPKEIAEDAAARVMREVVAGREARLPYTTEPWIKTMREVLAADVCETTDEAIRRVVGERDRLRRACGVLEMEADEPEDVAKEH